MYPALKVVLPKSGISANMEGAMRHGPSGSLGGGVLSWFHHMGTARTACLVEQMTHDTPLGKIIRINIEDLVMDSGVYGLLWDMNTEDI